MVRYSLKNDYSEGAHPAVLTKLALINGAQENGYGNDGYCKQAADLIKQYCNQPSSDVHFVSGGTQANIVALASMLKPYEAIIAVDTGHIAVHEAGAIEATGHKIYTVPAAHGKLTPVQISQAVHKHTDEHMVLPRVVFISHATERGTLYSKNELIALSQECKKHNLLLYLDGARLGSALTSTHASLTLQDIAQLCDMFYIGGTKNGALFGEAIVITNNDLKKNFRYHIKQHGALLAKGAALGAQFLALFENNLFFDIAHQANAKADFLAAALKNAGCSFLEEPVSNQLFPIINKKIIARLYDHFDFYVWQEIDNEHAAVRIITSWATEQKQIEKFVSLLT